MIRLGVPGIGVRLELFVGSGLEKGETDMYIYTYVCVCVCVYVYICVYVFVYGYMLVIYI